MIDHQKKATEKMMENPTRYRGYQIGYVTNDVAPETLTAYVVAPDGREFGRTSQRQFRDREAWHADIMAKIDRDHEAQHPTRKIEHAPLPPLGS